MFPGLPGGAQETFGGAPWDGVVARLTPSLAAVEPATPVPTLSTIGQVAAALLLLGIGLAVLRRRSAQAG